MSILSKLGAAFSGGAVEAVKTGAEIVEKWVPGAEKKHEMAREIDDQIAASTASARDHDARIGNVKGWFNDFVNGINRMIRPTVTLGLLGGVVGLWELPRTEQIDPVILGFAEIVLIFWFGGRALFKDLPSLIQYVKVTRAKQ